MKCELDIPLSEQNLFPTGSSTRVKYRCPWFRSKEPTLGRNSYLIYESFICICKKPILSKRVIPNKLFNVGKWRIGAAQENLTHGSRDIEQSCEGFWLVFHEIGVSIRAFVFRYTIGQKRQGPLNCVPPSICEIKAVDFREQHQIQTCGMSGR